MKAFEDVRRDDGSIADSGCFKLQERTTCDASELFGRNASAGASSFHFRLFTPVTSFGSHQSFTLSLSPPPALCILPNACSSRHTTAVCAVSILSDFDLLPRLAASEPRLERDRSVFIVCDCSHRWQKVLFNFFSVTPVSSYLLQFRITLTLVCFHWLSILRSHYSVHYTAHSFLLPFSFLA